MPPQKNRSVLLVEVLRQRIDLSIYLLHQLDELGVELVANVDDALVRIDV